MLAKQWFLTTSWSKKPSIGSWSNITTGSIPPSASRLYKPGTFLSQVEPRRPRHGPVKLIELFGRYETPTLTHTGLRVGSFQFQSPELALMWRELGRKAEFKVTTLVDYKNLGQILVKVDDRLVTKGIANVDGWMLVSGPAELANVSLR